MAGYRVVHFVHIDAIGSPRFSYFGLLSIFSPCNIQSQSHQILNKPAMKHHIHVIYHLTKGGNPNPHQPHTREL